MNNFNIPNKLINWLLKSDPSIRWQTMRDLLNNPKKEYETERKRIATEGWGKRFLKLQDEDGKWAGVIYSPKWISTTYTMMTLRRLGLSTSNNQAKKSCRLLLEKGFYKDGGINFFPSMEVSEVCVTGMILSLLSYFNYKDERINKLVEFIFSVQLNDGGWNCRHYLGDKHSSFHTTISVLEGLREFEKYSNKFSSDVRESQQKGKEFLLQHKLFKSHRTGNIFDPKMTRFAFPPRWRYDIMRALDYWQESNSLYDDRMNEAINLIIKKRNKDDTWNLQNRHPGKTFFEMEEVGKPSRWNTLRALRILKKYPNESL